MWRCLLAWLESMQQGMWTPMRRHTCDRKHAGRHTGDQINCREVPKDCREEKEGSFRVLISADQFIQDTEVGFWDLTSRYEDEDLEGIKGVTDIGDGFRARIAGPPPASPIEDQGTEIPIEDRDRAIPERLRLCGVTSRKDHKARGTVGAGVDWTSFPKDSFSRYMNNYVCDLEILFSTRCDTSGLGGGRWSAITLGRKLTDDPVSHKTCGNSIPFTVHGIANFPGSLFFFNVILILIFSLASQNIFLMSSSFSLVSLKNIHNLCFASFSFLLLRVLPVGTVSSSIGSSPSSEGVLTGFGRYSKGLGLGLSALSRARSIFGICTRIFTALQDAADSIGVVDRCSGVPVDQFGLVQRWLLVVGTSIIHVVVVAVVVGFLPPEHLSSNLLHYADDPPGHAGLHCCLVQVSKAQPCLAAQYRSMSGMEYRSMSDEGCWSTESECFRSTGVREYL
ncbi:hypothetical protein DY000_02030738 [Brassica cretica]|uniref:Uncharacterized protein n=1 Tax=Brassica cretica TaxID=69181 RepID=A0ABQ7DGM1_BRACR|nr:hypothetical protein DY000_02030738 [Brassica cretica]